MQSDNLAKARASAADFRDILGAENFFLELHDHGIEAQRKCNAALPGLAREFGLGLVAANDVHFLERSHHEAHDVMICIGTGRNVQDERRMHYVPELYFKTGAEMRALFPEHPEAITNTLEIAERCNLKLEFGTSKFPDYTPPAGKTREQYFRELCLAGFRARYGERAESEPELLQRLEFEIGVMLATGFVSYFLIVWDFIHYAKGRGIPVGPGRGSAAGSMVAYALGITDVDPIRFNLLFERFLNPERVSPPDIDIDFCQTRRGEVIEYVRQKYGERAVSQIVTFGTLGAKSVIRDVARVMGLKYADGDRIAKMVPTGPGNLNITLAEAAQKNAELQQSIENEPATRQLWEHATLLEGLSRNAGIHAAGVVISDRDLSEYIPLMRGNEGEVVSQFAMGPLTDLGLLKMDFLGLKTLTVIDDAVKLIRQREPDFDLTKIPFDDPGVFELLNRAEVVGLFQLDGGMAGFCRQFDFRSLDDIVALNALYRPGPMDLIPDYIRRKRGETKIKYAHPLLAEACADTYGLMIYQEQVMAAARILAGYTLGQADLLRRAMGKKDKAKMAEERETFIAGCATANKISAKKASEIFDLLEKFAGYGFNKSHSVAYGLISYQTAFLKVHYPVEFMAGLLSNEVNNTEKISILVGECKRMGIPILPPDVNRSGLKFTPEEQPAAAGDAEAPRKAIRYGLAAIKNVGQGAMEIAIRERERGGDFVSLEDFCRRLDAKVANRKMLESLVKAGAFDFLGRERAELFDCVEESLAAASSSQRDRASGQVSLFDDLPPPAPKTGLRAVVPWTQHEAMTFEKELLGFYVTGHPLDAYAGTIAAGKYQTIISLSELADRATFRLAGAITQVDRKFTKREGKPFAVVWLEDLTGNLEVVLWNEVYVKVSELLLPGRVVAIQGTIDKRDDSVRATAQKLKVLAADASQPAAPAVEPTPTNGSAPATEASAMVLRFAPETTREDLREVRDILATSPGFMGVRLIFENAAGERVRLDAGNGMRVEATPELREKLARWL